MSLRTWKKWDWSYVVKGIVLVGCFAADELWFIHMIVERM